MARLGEILVEAEEISAAQLDAALAEQAETGRPLGMTLVRMGAIDELTLIRTLAKQLSLPMARLSGKRISEEVRDLVPFDLAEKHRCCPLFVKDEAGTRALYLGMADASDTDAIAELSERVGMPVRPVLVAPSEIEEALHRQYDRIAAGESGSFETPPLQVAGSDSDGEVALPPADGDPVFSVGAPESQEPSDTSLGAQDDDFDLSDGGFDLAGDAPGGPAEEPLQLAGEPPPAAGSEAEPPLDFSDSMADDPLEDSLGDFGPTPALETEPAAPAPPAARPGAIPADAILRALSQLLVEKGVISREEFIERVHRESEKGG
jgi:hypothetical protein